MFDRLKKLFSQSASGSRRKFFEMTDSFNAHLGAGQPTTIEECLGTLALHSGSLAIGDPTDAACLQVHNIGGKVARVIGTLWKYPNGSCSVVGIRLLFGDDDALGQPRTVGKVYVDSAKIVVADLADIGRYWTDVGPDRIGVILIPSNDNVLRLLKKRFQLKVSRVESWRAEVVGPVSATLEAEIEQYLKSIPEYADYPFMHFHVQTNNSFDRANYLDKPWSFMPIGNTPEPVMFVCRTGRGDGCYDVMCRYDGDIPRVLSIDFLADSDGQ